MERFTFPKGDRPFRLTPSREYASLIPYASMGGAPNLNKAAVSFTAALSTSGQYGWYRAGTPRTPSSRYT